MRRSDAFAVSMLIGIAVTFVSAQVARGVAASLDGDSPSVAASEATPTDTDPPASPKSEARAAAAPVANIAMARLQEAARYDDWRAIDAASAALVSAR